MARAKVILVDADVVSHFIATYHMTAYKSYKL